MLSRGLAYFVCARIGIIPSTWLYVTLPVCWRDSHSQLHCACIRTLGNISRLTGRYMHCPEVWTFLPRLIRLFPFTNQTYGFNEESSCEAAAYRHMPCDPKLSCGIIDSYQSLPLLHPDLRRLFDKRSRPRSSGESQRKRTGWSSGIPSRTISNSAQADSTGFCQPRACMERQ